MMRRAGRFVSHEWPRTSITPSNSLLVQQATCFFSCSAVSGPMAIWYFSCTYWAMQLSKALPATGRLAALTRPPILMTAMSVEPPPMSTTMQPWGWRICKPAPSAAATGSSTR